MIANAPLRAAAFLAFAAGVTLCPGAPARGLVDIVPAHVVWAERLVSEVPPARNRYAWSPTYVVWSEDNDGPARNRSVCSSFVSHDLMRAYGLTRDDLMRRFGTRNPQAKDYYAAIAAQRGFTLVPTIDAVAPGDIIAFAYPPGSHPTGHVMIVDGPPKLHRATAPVEAGTQQYEVAVIDSSASYHGLRDTRYVQAGKHGSGVGRGTLRLYANGDGTPAGYAWSTRAISKYEPIGEHRIAIGRYNTAPFAPAPGNGGGDEAGDAPASVQPQ